MKRKGGFWSVLPLDLKVHIFSLLPEKNLKSLRVVCNDWNYVISRFFLPRICPPNPRAPVWGFLCAIDDGLHEGPTLHLRPFVTYEVEHMILSLLPPEHRETADFQDCCNGMTLFATNNNCGYYVGNPVTGQRFRVPVNPNTNTRRTTRSRSRRTTRSSLVFDPSLFLCDNKDPFFKVVNFVRPAQEATVARPMMVDIYSSDKDEWCSHVVELEPHLYGFQWLQRYVYFKRALYSLSKARYLVWIDNVVPKPYGEGLRARAIALPDRDEKRSKQIPNKHPGYLGCIGCCSERFYYSNVSKVQGSSVSVWMLGSSEWVLMSIISIKQDIGRCREFDDPKMAVLKGFAEYKLKRLKKKPSSFRTCAFHPRSENGVTVFFSLPNAFVSYNIRTGSSTLQLPAKRIKDGNWFFPFSPCLLRLQSSREMLH